MGASVDSICNFRYAKTRSGGSAFPDVRGLLRYLQYRNDRDGHLPAAGGPDRWVDGGLGSRYQQILSRLDELSPANRHAYLHSIVVSPDPKEMARVEGDPHARFVDAVRASLQAWDEWRQAHDPAPQAGPIEYSLVVHRPERDYGEQMHAHVILAAATEDPMTGETTPLYNNREHMERFKEITYGELDRVYGRDRAPERDWPEPEEAPKTGITFGQVEMDREIEFFPFYDHKAGEAS